jgi:membrane-associated phospholipid phosphatase
MAGRLLTRTLLRLRVEEVVALLFLLPTSYLTLRASWFAQETGVLGARHSGGLVRLAVAAVFFAALLGARWVWPRSRWVRETREVLPFVVCVLIYTNLHDTIGLVNPNDVHHFLAGLDQALFGVQPSVWAQRFISRELTELMNFFYVSFVWIAPATSVWLLAQGRREDFRAATMAVVSCLYLGYFLYVLLPAAPPRLVLVYEYTQTLQGYSQFFSTLSARAFELLPLDSRAAFPSLHAAVSLVALVCAFRFVRPLFFVLLPFVVGLWVSTIYLRHHYFVDLLAGWALAPLALAVAPRLDRFWRSVQRRAAGRGRNQRGGAMTPALS